MSQPGKPLSPDDIFGPSSGAVTPDDVFGPAPNAQPLSGDFWDGMFSFGTMGAAIGGFAQGVKDQWGAISAGAQQEKDELLQKSGVYKDIDDKYSGLAKTFNESFVRPAVYGLVQNYEAAKELATAAVALPVAGVQGALAAGGAAAEKTPIGRVIGAEKLGETLAGGVEYEVSRGDLLAPRYLGGGAAAHLPEPVAAARGLGVIGEGEAGYFGTEQVEPEAETQRAAAVRAQAKTETAAEKASGAPEPAPGTPPEVVAPPASPPVPDVNDVARQIAPGTFQKYDALATRQATYRQWLAELGEQRAQSPAAQAAQSRIDDILGKVGGVEERLTKAAAERLDAARADLDAATTTDTPDMAFVRRNLLAVQHALWDLAPDVRAAMQEAAQRVPEAVPESAPAETVSAPQNEEVPAPSQLESPRVIPEGAAGPVIGTSDVVGKTFTTAKGSTYEVHGDGTTTRNKAARSDAGHEGDSGIKKRSAKTVYVDTPEQASSLSAAGLHGLGPKGARVVIKDGKASLAIWNEKAGRWGVSPSSRDIPISTEPSVRKAPLELWNPKDDVPGHQESYSGMHAGNAITEIKEGGHAEPARNIAADVSRQLTALGRPQDEADAAGALVQAHYDARAARFGGAKGTARQLYDREAPEIRAGKTRAPVTEMAQRGESVRKLKHGKRGSILLRAARNIIKLFSKADASTFIHETGHDWLEELMRDARDEKAPDDLLADAATVRDWLGVKEGEAIPRRAHEKFARGFERYMMEGAAPSKRLANIFAKFKAWLTQIYQTVNRLKSPITPEIRQVFDRLLVTPGHEPIIAPDRALPESLAELHEREAETTPPHHADIVADNAEKETEQIAGVHAPEVQDELAGKTGRIAAPAPGAASRDDAAGPISGENRGAAELGEVTAGGGEASQARAGGRKVTSVFVRVPREPLRLLDFIRRAGGIRDDRGDIATIIGGDKKMARRLLNRSGASLDYMTQRAWDAGYFPDAQGERPTIQDMLDKIDQDYRGQPQYSERDFDAVQAYQSALARNAEAERLADELGLDPKDPDFWTKVSEHMSVEDMAAQEASRAAAAADEFEEAQRRAKEYLESRGEAWEPDELYGDVQSRTLEDLENERRSEIVARNAGQGQVGAVPSRPAPADPGSVQAGGGPGGDGAGISGRAGQENTDDPDAPIPAPDKLIDKAGNIRLDNLNTTEDARAIVRQLARDNMDFKDARFGTASYALYHEIKASGQLLVEAAERAAEAKQAWIESGFDEALAAKYVEATQQTLLAAEIRAELAAGTGRGLGAFKKVDRIAEAENMVDYIKRSTGKTYNQLADEARLLNQMDTPEEQSRFLADSRMTRWQKTRGGILSYFINNLISGPITHLAYMIGNTVWALAKAIPETAVAATFDSLRGAGGADRVYYGEVGAQLYGMYRGLRDGLVPAWRAARTGISFMRGVEDLARAEAEREGVQGEFELERPPTNFDRPQQIFPNSGPALKTLGYVLETPSRAVSAIHTIFYGMNYEAEIARRAFRSGVAKGLDGEALNTHIANFTQHPPEQEIAAAHDEALKMVLMKRPAYDSAMASFQRAVNNNMAAKMVMPFMQIGTNLLEQGFVEHTPLGLMSQAVRDNLSGRNGQVARSTQYAKIMVGTGVAISVAGLTAEGTLTDGGPSDPKKFAALERTGWKPYSIRIGEFYVPYRKYLGPLGPLVAGVSDMYGIAHDIGHETATQIAAATMFGFSEVVADETWMSGLANFIDAARHWDEPQKAERYLTGLATDFIPFSIGMRQMATLLDPYRRQQADLISAAKAGIPGLSQTLLPQRDVWGDPILAHIALGPSQSVQDPVDREFLSLDKYYPAKLNPQIRGVRLTPEQYDDYARVAGRYAKMLLQQDVESPGWATLPEETRADILRKHLTAARETARSMMMAEHPDIMSAATAIKAQRLGSVPPASPSP